MLSSQTLHFLDDLCTTSNGAYPEGGVLWTYIEGANQAHARFDDHRRTPLAGDLKLSELETWFQVALGDWSRNQSASLAVHAATELLRLLSVDTGSDQFLWAFEEGDSDMTANIYIARASDNHFFALELWWSLD
jgi:hypothetical protein